MFDHAHTLQLIEAALLASPHPVSIERLLLLFPEAAEIDEEAIRSVLVEIESIYSERAIHLKKTAEGYTFWVDIPAYPELQKWFADKPPRYSKAVMETLAIIAYRQPVTRPEIEDIRGVAVSPQTMRTLEERQWIEVVGCRETPGRPALYGTTRTFLSDFQLASLSDLEPLQNILTQAESSEHE